MNYYIKAQIANMISMVQTFEQSCEMAEKQDDEKIGKAEEKTIKKINKATKHFIKALETISK